MTAQDIAVALWVGVTLGICLIQQYELDQLKRQVAYLVEWHPSQTTVTMMADFTADPTQTELMQ